MFSKFFIERPVFACVVSILIVLMGAVSYFALPVAKYPELAPPVVRVEATYPGASAQTVADTVAAPLEQEVNGVDRMIYMSSVSSEGRYQLDIAFEPGTNVDIASVLVQNRVSIALPRVPDEVRRQGVNTKKQSTAMVGVVALHAPGGQYDDLYLSNYMSINLKDEIARINGVGASDIYPQKDYGMRIWLDPARLRARNLTAGDVNEAIREQNVQVAAGSVGRQPAPEGQAFEFTVNTLGRLSDPGQFADIIVKTDEQGRLVRIRDLGRVELGTKDYSSASTFNGRASAIMVIYQLPGANLVEVATKVGQTLDVARARPDFPEGLELVFFYDSSMFIHASMEEVNKTLLEAFLLVVLVVLVFLQSWRTTIIPIVAIPVSLIGTFLFMALFGFSMNMLTMFGLVLAIGIVVDDAIVVVENVERVMAEEHLDPKPATIKAMEEISGPIIAITLVLMAVFLPAAAQPGISGEMFRQFALTIAASTFISAVCALTLTPALCAIILKPHAKNPKKPPLLLRPLSFFGRAFNRVFDGVTAGYAGIARFGVRRLWIALPAFAGVLVVSWMVARSIPTGFVPEEDLGFLVINAQLPDAASLERTQGVLDQVSAAAAEVEGVSNVVGLAGSSVIDGRGPNYATGYIVLEPWEERVKSGRGIAVIIQDLNERLREIQEAQFLVFSLPAIDGLGNASGFDMRLQDRTALGRAAMAQVVGEMVAAANAQSRLRAVYSGFRAATPQVFVDIDREKALKLGVPLSTVFETLQTYLGAAYVNDFNLFNRTYQVNVQAESTARIVPDDIIRLEVRNRNGEMLPLAALARVSASFGPDRVNRYNLYPSAAINGSPATGVSSGEAMSLMEQMARDKMPAGMGYEWTGMSFQEKQIGGQGNTVFVLALVIVYLILAAQYESWAMPLAVVLSVPLVLIGAMGALALRGLDNNLFTQIGLVLLVGLGAKNAILIVEFARAMRQKGEGLIDSAVKAARLRFRPILMTSFAFILGVVPLVVATGAGAASRQAIGTVVFGGMLGVTILSLLFTPALFVLIQGISERAGRKSRAKAAAVAAPAVG